MANISHRTKVAAARLSIEVYAIIKRRATKRGLGISDYIKWFISNDVRRKR